MKITKTMLGCSIEFHTSDEEAFVMKWLTEKAARPNVMSDEQQASRSPLSGPDQNRATVG